MALSRSLYSTQFLKIYINETGAGGINPLTVGGVGYEDNVVSGLPVQSASIERTVPTEDIMILGKLGSAGRQQKDVETVKMDIKIYWASGERANSSAPGTGLSDNLDTRLSANELGRLTGNALKGERSIIVVEPNGFTGLGILTNFSIDAGVGDFLTASMSFEGFGTPLIATTVNPADVEATGYAPKSVFVYTSENVRLSGVTDDLSNNETIKSAKFSIDIPTERLSRLGAATTGLQSRWFPGASTTDAEKFTGNHLLVAKPPFKVSMSYEGQFVSGDHSLTPLSFGHVTFTPEAASITSQNYSQNAGDVGASMSLSFEGTNCRITDTTGKI